MLLLTLQRGVLLQRAVEQRPTKGRRQFVFDKYRIQTLPAIVGFYKNAQFLFLLYFSCISPVFLLYFSRRRKILSVDYSKYGLLLRKSRRQYQKFYLALSSPLFRHGREEDERKRQKDGEAIAPQLP
jgi:hypothetical protein